MNPTTPVGPTKAGGSRGCARRGGVGEAGGGSRQGARPPRLAAAGALERERPGAVAQAACSLALALAWIAAGLLMGSAAPRPVFAVQLLLAGALAVLVRASRRTRRVTVLRWQRLVAFLAGGATAVPLLPGAEPYVVYVAGLSLAIWAAALLPPWPVRWGLAAYALLVAIHAVTFPAYPRGQRLAFLGATFYLASAAVCTSVILVVAVRLERRASLLSSQVARRRRELERTLSALHAARDRVAASEKMSTLGVLLAGLSAALEGPVREIGSRVERLECDVGLLVAGLAPHLAGGGDPAVAAAAAELDLAFALQDAPSAVHTMARGARRMAQVHSDLSTFMRGEAPDLEPADVDALLSAAVELVRRAIPPGVALHAEHGELPVVVCRPGQLGQVFLNLLQNALDAVGERGEVRTSTARVGDVVEVAIEDDGPGVSPEHVGRLFEPFFTTKPVGKGTGLGLAVSHEIARSHGGALVYAPSSHGRGARFVLRLPLHPGAAVSPPPA